MPSVYIEISLPPELRAFVTLVLADAQLQQRLAPIAEKDAFIAEALRVAEVNGIALDQDVLADCLRPDPLGVGRFAGAPITYSTWPPTGWIPTRSIPTGEAPAFDWQYFGEQRLSLPFMEDDVRNASSLPFNWLFRIRTSLDAVMAGSATEPHIPLSGLIFHMSRCGSTLMAQMFAAVPEHIVSSEPEPLDAVIQWARLADIDDETAVTALRAIVSALGRDRGYGAQRHIIKLDAWHTFSLPLFRAAFPNVNWIYLYRDATEVMVSTMQQPGLHTAPGALPESVVGFAFDPSTSLENYAARVLAEVGNSVLRNWHLGGGMLIAYPDIVKAATVSIAAHFNVAFDEASTALVAAAALRDAKSPQQLFVSDVARKQTAKTVAVVHAVDQWMKPVQIALEQLAKSTAYGSETQ
jgi:hypothetical protein